MSMGGKKGLWFYALHLQYTYILHRHLNKVKSNRNFGFRTNALKLYNILTKYFLSFYLVFVVAWWKNRDIEEERNREREGYIYHSVILNVI